MLKIHIYIRMLKAHLVFEQYELYQGLLNPGDKSVESLTTLYKLVLSVSREISIAPV